MIELYRFDVDYPMHPEDEEGMKHIPCDNGDYVLAEDALALQAKVKELEEKLHWKVVSHIAADDRIEELEAAFDGAMDMLAEAHAGTERMSEVDALRNRRAERNE